MKKLSKQETLQALMRKYLLENIDEITSFILSKKDENQDVLSITEEWMGNSYPSKINLSKELSEIKAKCQEINADRFLNVYLEVTIYEDMNNKFKICAYFLKDGIDKIEGKNYYSYKYEERHSVDVEGYAATIELLKKQFIEKIKLTIKPQTQEVVL